MLIICDIDGCLADVDPLVKKYLIENNNWDEYFKHMSEVEPITEVCNLVRTLISLGNEVVFVTGRSEDKCRKDTENWLRKYITNSSFRLKPIMRHSSEQRQTYEVKMDVYKLLKLDLIIEDEPRCCEAAQKEGFTVLQVRGYRSTEKDGSPYIDHMEVK